MKPLGSSLSHRIATIALCAAFAALLGAGRAGMAQTGPDAGAPPAATPAAPSDCFAVTREIRRLEGTIAALKAGFDKLPPGAKGDAQKEIDDAQARLASANEEAKSCWYTLHIHAVRVSDCCAGTRPAPIAPEQVARWVAKANEVYSVARVRFEFDPTPGWGDWATLNSTEVNSLAGEFPGDAVWERGKAAGNDLASHYPRKVLVFFRYGPDKTPTGGGFSSDGYNFVVLPGFDVTTLCGNVQNEYLLAHEMGHYFGLNHTFRQFKTQAEAAAALRAAGNNPDAFDGDGLSETPPEPYIEDLQCTTDPLVVLNGVPFPLLRTNVMSYYKGDTKTLTPQQATVVRSWVERRFAAAMDREGPWVPDERWTYQIASLASGMVLEVAGASKNDGARVELADLSRTAPQSWRVIPLTAQDAGWFEIAALGSGKCLTLGVGIAKSGAALVQAEWQGKNNQKWRFVQDEDGDLAIESKQGRMVLGVAGSATGSKAPGESRRGVVTAEPSSEKVGANQRWRLLPLN